jgi:tetratricopeptide (TPR) repeat protein
LKRTILLLLLFSFAFTLNLKAQKEYIDALVDRFVELYASGDLINAETTLHLLLNSRDTLAEEYVVSCYNNLGVLNILLGKYNKALEYNIKAESLISNKEESLMNLADIYANRARIFTLLKSYSSAIEYFEKSLRIYNEFKNPEKIVFQNMAITYMNLGIVYFENRNYNLASSYLKKSSELKIMHNLSELAPVFQNIAKTFVKTKNPVKAEEFYCNSLSSYLQEFGQGYYRMAEVYFDYGLFLRSEGRDAESLEMLEKALTICLKNYGEKHTLVSLSYKLIGDHYVHISDYEKALDFYQKSLIAVANNFNDNDIYSNPSVDSAIFNIRLLDNLKSKSQALELLSNKQNDQHLKLKTLGMSFGTIELALQLIDTIRNNYPSEESRIYLAENEKETYMFATHLAFSLFLQTHEEATAYKMYSIAQKAKAAILRNEITGNDLLYSAGIPDSLREKQNSLRSNIAAYNNLILEELRRRKPDSSKIIFWKDALFDMNREREKVTGEIASVFPQYHDLIRKTDPVSITQIRKKLRKNETIIDYLLSNQYNNGERKLYIFLISKDRLECRESRLDSLFTRNAEILLKTAEPGHAGGAQSGYFRGYTEALNYMYLNLIKPVEELIDGKKLIIIPDEEIGWLSFDTFLKNMPVKGLTDYEGLPFLIKDYTFSYGYSSSLIFHKKSLIAGGGKVIAFAPDYPDTSLTENSLHSLRGAELEIGSIYKYFRGVDYSGIKATKASFLASLPEQAILHLAMHSVSDSSNSRYSYLIFDSNNAMAEESKLYNYEISLTRINSPMVVLSACNSGTGTLYSGEGLMSLARGFTLAGASSVIKTAWEINDEASAAIMTRFYRHLSKGMRKNDAMRMAKLEYLADSPPAYSNPYYWAGYEVLGDRSPVIRRPFVTVLIMIGLVVMFAAVVVLSYLRRRRISAERS